MQGVYEELDAAEAEEALYPRRLWQLEVALFAVAVAVAVGETLRRVAVGRRVS